MKFGEYLKKTREENKLSIRQLAMYSTVSASYISQIENGERNKPKPEILHKLSKPLKVSYEELMEKAGYLEEDSTAENDYDPLSELNKLIKKYGIEDMGFFDIEEWKNFGPEDIKLLDAQFKLIAKLAKERNQEKD